MVREEDEFLEKLIFHEEGGIAPKCLAYIELLDDIIDQKEDDISYREVFESILEYSHRHGIISYYRELGEWEKLEKADDIKKLFEY